MLLLSHLEQFSSVLNFLELPPMGNAQRKTLSALLPTLSRDFCVFIDNAHEKRCNPKTLTRFSSVCLYGISNGYGEEISFLKKYKIAFELLFSRESVLKHAMNDFQNALDQYFYSEFDAPKSSIKYTKYNKLFDSAITKTLNEVRRGRNVNGNNIVTLTADYMFEFLEKLRINLEKEAFSFYLEKYTNLAHFLSDFESWDINVKLSFEQQCIELQDVFEIYEQLVIENLIYIFDDSRVADVVEEITVIEETQAKEPEEPDYQEPFTIAPKKIVITEKALSLLRFIEQKHKSEINDFMAEYLLNGIAFLKDFEVGAISTFISLAIARGFSREEIKQSTFGTNDIAIALFKLFSLNTVEDVVQFLNYPQKSNVNKSKSAALNELFFASEMENSNTARSVTKLINKYLFNKLESLINLFPKEKIVEIEEYIELNYQRIFPEENISKKTKNKLITIILIMKSKYMGDDLENIFRRIGVSRDKPYWGYLGIDSEIEDILKVISSNYSIPFITKSEFQKVPIPVVGTINLR